MTENTWPQTEGLDPNKTDFPAGQASPVSSGQHAASPVPASSGSSGTSSTSEAAKAEAGDVARQAADAAAKVTETAKDEVAHVAAEVKTNARDLMAQATSDLTEQAGTQQQKVAEGLRSVSTELQAMVSSAEEPGMATDLVRQAAERSSAVASWLEDRDPGSLLADVKNYARQKPGTFLLLAAGAGILAGRLSRSLSAGAPDSTGSASPTVSRAGGVGGAAAPVPPVPVVPPTVETPLLGVPDAYPPAPAGPLAGSGAPDRWDSEPVATGPLHTVDPLRNDPFDGDRQ